MRRDLSGRKRGGFTLIELLIAVAVIAILTAIAYPMYQDQVRKSRRAAVKGSILQVSQFMERYYTENRRYSKDAGGNTTMNMDDVYNASFMKDPNSVEQYYDLTINSDLNTYTVSAAPKSGQDNDKCKTLGVTSTGSN